MPLMWNRVIDSLFQFLSELVQFVMVETTAQNDSIEAGPLFELEIHTFFKNAEIYRGQASIQNKISIVYSRQQCSVLNI